MSAVLTDPTVQNIAASLGFPGIVEKANLDTMIESGLIPAEFGWEPTGCYRVGDRYLLLHLLQTRELPRIILEAKGQLPAGALPTVHILVVATEVEEQLEEEVRILRPAWAAGGVAGQCVENGIGLAFIEGQGPTLVFPPSYQVPAKCRDNRPETGHIPKWLYERVAALQTLSPYLSRVMKKFAGKYARETGGNGVDYDREVKLLTWLADEIKDGDPRLFIPTGQIQVLREYERQGASKRTRDHFFHTFNNLLMGYYILGFAQDGRESHFPSG